MYLKSEEYWVEQNPPGSFTAGLLRHMQVFTVVLQKGLYSIFHLQNDWTLNTLFFKYIAWIYRFMVYIDISW